VPLLAASLTKNPTAIAGATIAATLPFLLLALVSGTIVDRVDRRQIMVSVSLVRGGVLALFAVAALTGHMSLWEIYVLAILMGTAETLFDNAAQSILPSIVPDRQLDSANGRMTATVTAGNEFLGPAAGSLLFSVAAYVPFACASVLALCAGALSRLLPSSDRAESGGAAAASGILAEIAEGFRWVRRQSSLWPLALTTAIVGLTDSAWYAILVLYAIQIIHLVPAAYGLLLAAGGLGAVAGGMVAGQAARRLGVSGAIALAVAGMGGTQLALGLTSATPLAFAALTLSSACFAVFNSLAVSTRQRLTPTALLGRVNSVFRFLGLGMAPLGAAAGGFLASSVNLRAPFLAGAPLVILAALLLWLSSSGKDTAGPQAKPDGMMP
jgi:MFS family permease